MARFTTENAALAEDIIARYPVPKSALIPLLHLAQEQDGYLTDDAMEHIAELVGVTPAEVLGTCSFYEMFKREPVGDYVVNVCTNISCMLLGGEELLHHLEHRLGIKAGDTTPDGKFTLEDVECIAACTEAPCLQVELPLLPPHQPRRGRRADRRPAGRQAGPRGAPPRHAQPGPPAAPRQPGRGGAARPQRRAAVAGPQRPRPRRRRARDRPRDRGVGRRRARGPPHRQRRAGTWPTATRSTATARPAATRLWARPSTR